jgi:hypothetical protein
VKGVQACQQRDEAVYEKADGACTSSRKMIILSSRKAALQSHMEYFARKYSKIMLCEVVATSMASFRVV